MTGGGATLDVLVVPMVKPAGLTAAATPPAVVCAMLTWTVPPAAVVTPSVTTTVMLPSVNVFVVLFHVGDAEPVTPLSSAIYAACVAAVRALRVDL